MRTPFFIFWFLSEMLRLLTASRFVASAVQKTPMTAIKAVSFRQFHSTLEQCKSCFLLWRTYTLLFHIYIYIYRERERENKKEKQREKERERENRISNVIKECEDS